MKKRPTSAQMKKALKWGVTQLHLEAWDIHLLYRDKLPKWWDGSDKDAGGSWFLSPRRWAKVFVRPGRCELCGADIYETLFHELVHVRLSAMGWESDKELPEEWACDDFAALMRKAYR